MTLLMTKICDIPYPDQKFETQFMSRVPLNQNPGSDQC